MTSTKISTKKLEALNKLALKDDMRYYANGVYIDTKRQKAVVSDNMMLLSTPVVVDAESDSFIVGKSHIATQAKVAKVTKEEFVEVTDEQGVIPGEYPNYEKAFPRKENFSVCFSLENLKKMVEALSKGAERKDAKVKLIFESQDRPMKVECEDMTGLIAPTMEV